MVCGRSLRQTAVTVLGNNPHFRGRRDGGLPIFRRHHVAICHVHDGRMASESRRHVPTRGFGFDHGNAILWFDCLGCDVITRSQAGLHLIRNSLTLQSIRLSDFCKFTKRTDRTMRKTEPMYIFVNHLTHKLEGMNTGNVFGHKDEYWMQHVWLPTCAHADRTRGVVRWTSCLCTTSWWVPLW